MHGTGRVMTSVTLKGSITEYIRGHAIKKKRETEASIA